MCLREVVLARNTKYLQTRLTAEAHQTEGKVCMKSRYLAQRNVRGTEERLENQQL
jgi:hypothetical protein